MEVAIKLGPLGSQVLCHFGAPSICTAAKEVTTTIELADFVLTHFSSTSRPTRNTNAPSCPLAYPSLLVVIHSLLVLAAASSFIFWSCRIPGGLLFSLPSLHLTCFCSWNPTPAARSALQCPTAGKWWLLPLKYWYGGTWGPTRC